MKIFNEWADLAEWYRANGIYSTSGCECTKQGCKFGRKDFAPSQCGNIGKCPHIRGYNDFGIYTKAPKPWRNIKTIPETSTMNRDEAALAWFNISENRQQMLDKKEALKQRYGIVGE